ncbi:helix-turn-helix domain-containing protein [Acinetobacter sp. Gutcm_16]|uniref:helix-turn-helix domain-containing protein n=1 Tax=Acinetobacter sp. Gutcm_16 TaxID=3026087 RepID=UPI002360B45B|nr:helix-turn-helix domain-containing protein [Acinetobacter sp. Gutcm_16]MDD0802311.1 helix-turn-helix domain-containing protein [Acinetobacter sp. Gutcm_16]
MQTLSLNEAANFLRMHPEELRRRAKLGQIPAAKPAKSWVFIEDDLAEYLRSFYASPRQALQVTSSMELKQCHLSNATTYGGLTSPHRAVSELDALLQRKIKSKRKNSMID